MGCTKNEKADINVSFLNNKIPSPDINMILEKNNIQTGFKYPYENKTSFGNNIYSIICITNINDDNADIKDYPSVNSKVIYKPQKDETIFILGFSGEKELINDSDQKEVFSGGTNRNIYDHTIEIFYEYDELAFKLGYTDEEIMEYGRKYSKENQVPQDLEEERKGTGLQSQLIIKCAYNLDTGERKILDGFYRLTQ